MSSKLGYVCPRCGDVYSYKCRCAGCGSKTIDARQDVIAMMYGAATGFHNLPDIPPLEKITTTCQLPKTEIDE